MDLQQLSVEEVLLIIISLVEEACAVASRMRLCGWMVCWRNWLGTGQVVGILCSQSYGDDLW